MSRAGPNLAMAVGERLAIERQPLEFVHDAVVALLLGEASPGKGRRTHPRHLASGPLTKDELVSGLKARNFPFFGSPKTALDPVLYEKKFKREGKLFRLGEAHE